METEEVTEAKKKRSHRTGWIIAGAIFVCLAVVGGIYFYTHSLKKDLADPIQAIPSDVSFFVQINDYKDFVTSSNECKDYLNDAFSLGALDGMTYFISLFNENVQHNQMAFSGHVVAEKMVFLLSARAKESDFENLLKALNINENNNSEYNGVRVYELGTHHRPFFFCFRHGIFSIAENESLLRASIDCLASPKCVAQQPGMQPLLDMMSKNTKQNWLVVNHNNFIDSQLKNVSPEFASAFADMKKMSDWSAYQMIVRPGEISFFGYSTLKDGSLLKRFEGQRPQQNLLPGKVIPSEVDSYFCFNFSDAEAFAKSNEVGQQSRNDFMKLQSNVFHCFTMSDTAEYRFFAVKCTNVDTSYVESLLPGDCTLDSADAYGILPSGISHFAGALSTQWSSFSASYFIVKDDCLVFSDSPSALKKYILSVENNKLLKDNQIFVALREDGRWADHTPFQFFFNNTEQALDNCLKPSLVSRHSKLRNTKYLLFNSLPICNNLIPNNIYIRFSAE